MGGKKKQRSRQRKVEQKAKGVDSTKFMKRVENYRRTLASATPASVCCAIGDKEAGEFRVCADLQVLRRCPVVRWCSTGSSGWRPIGASRWKGPADLFPREGVTSKAWGLGCPVS